MVSVETKNGLRSVSCYIIVGWLKASKLEFMTTISKAPN